MAYKVGDAIDTQPYEVYVIEASMPTATGSKWTPLPVTATAASRKYASDKNRCMRLGLIRLDSIMAYMDVGIATKVFDDVSASFPPPHLIRLVKMTADFDRFYQAGTDV